MSKDETIAELKRQIRAYEATVHNLNLQLEAAGAGEVQAPVAWRLWDDEPGDTPRWVYYDISDFKEGINPESIFDGLNPLFDKPQPAPSIGAEVRKQDESLIRQMLEALVESNATLWEVDDDPARPAQAAIAAARARLGEGGGV